MASDEERLTAPSSLNSDLDYSSKCYSVYRKYARRPEIKETWTRRVFGTTVVDLLRGHYCSQELRALGIGSGSGEVESWILSELNKSFPKIFNLSIEPSVEELTKYKEHVAANTSKLEGITFDWHQQTLQVYRQSCKVSSESVDATFHLITAIHSLYYEPDLDSVLAYLYSRLARHGVLIVALDSDEDGFGQLRSQLPQAWDEKYHYCSANHVKCHFDKLNIPYTTINRPSQVDVTQCFSQCVSRENGQVPLQSPESGDGVMLLNFIFQVANFHLLVPPKQDQLLRFLRSICTTVDDGLMMLQCDSEYVIAVKE